MFADEDIVLVSAVEHYFYCPRQFALMYVEQSFVENEHTLRGDAVHMRVDQVHVVRHEGVRAEYAVPLWSDVLGLAGRADVVEFLEDGTVWPVEYKHGPRVPREHDDAQLCAQALCLEEMLGVSVRRGSIYHHLSRRWREVPLTDELRRRTQQAITEMREMLRSGNMPSPLGDSRCRHCSLLEVCEPTLLSLAASDDTGGIAMASDLEE
ncbi:MAG: CRISPR-associated protein Cas4 [Coriobacteriia bacterium]